LPGIYAKALLVRGQGLTNVFINEAFGYYDYISLGVA
jgi:peptide/nickel transport system substrate-binding protein